MERTVDDPAVIAYTSGTTGRPKGVVHTLGAVSRQLSLLASLHRLGPGDHVYQAVPLFPLPAYLPQVAAALHGGAAVILADKFDLDAFAETSRRYPIAYVTLSSPMLALLTDLPPDRRPTLDALRVMTVGGAPLRQDQRAQFEDAVGVHISQGYGMTEVLGVFVADYDGAPEGSCGRQHPSEPRLVVALDDAGAVCAPGQTGEIAVHRSCALHSYWNDPQRTEDAFDGEWFRTGDIGRVDADGYYYVLDRKKDVVIRGGFNIYSAEIERVLVDHPAVVEAVVVAAPHDRLGEVPVAFVVAAGSGGEELAEQIRAFAVGRLGALKAPERVVLVSAGDVPRNAIGKPLKRDLRDQLAAHLMDHEP